MKLVRALLVASLILPALPSQAAAAEEEGWESFGHALSLVQTLVGIAARSDNPEANLKGIDDVQAGRNAEANRAMAGLFQEATSDMPMEYRDKVAAIGRDLTSMARKGIAKSPQGSGPAFHGTAPGELGSSVEHSIQARKDLNAMGLSYHDPKQFLDAVRRDDALAVELYVVGRGVNLASRDADGRSAVDIARANGNARVTELLARNLPAAR
jgi:hypothetical protein